MINLSFLNPQQNKIFFELYELTEGKIILSGSSSLALNGVINRPVGNINVNLNKEDVEYFNIINNEFKMDYVRNQEFGIKNKTYWFRKYNTAGVLFFSDDVKYDTHLVDGLNIRAVTVEEIRNNKDELSKSGDPNWIKHYNDVQTIDKFNNVQKPKTLI